MASTEQAFAGQAAEFGGGQVITSPFQFVADPSTFLRIVSSCSAPGVTVAIQGRRLDDAGKLQPIVETHTPLATRTVVTQDLALGSGAILNLTVFASAGAPKYGQCYVMLQLIRNVGNVAIVLGTLVGGYITGTQALGFPGSPVRSSLDGIGFLRTIVGTTPAPGQESIETVPTGARWQMLGWINGFNTSGVAGGRYPRWQGDDGANSVFNTMVLAGVPASFNWTYYLAIGTPALVFGGTNEENYPLPDRLFLLPGYRFRTRTKGIDVGDTWQHPSYCVREWLEVG